MSRFDFCGPSYQALTSNADAEETINLFPTVMEASAKSKMILEPTPGLKLFAALPTPMGKFVRGSFSLFSNIGQTFPGRTFAAVGPTLYEVHRDGSFIAFTQAIVDDGLPVYFAAGPNGSAGGGKWQLLISSGGTAYVLDLTAAPPAGLSIVSDGVGKHLPAGLTIAKVEFMDGYGIALLANTNTFWISALNDFTDWAIADGAGSASVSVFTDNVIGMIVNQKILGLFGPKQTVWYEDIGDPNFPFAFIEGSLIEEGTIAAASLVKINNSVFFLSGDDRGAGIVYRMSGYTPQRVSNYAVELSLRNLPTAGGPPLADAIGWAEVDAGHSFYVLYIPAGNMTWVYDLGNGMWHKRLYWNSIVPGSNPAVAYDPAWPVDSYTAHLARTHTYNWGKHLVGDRLSGNLYEMSQNFFTDAGYPLRRMRRAPNISTEEEYEFHNRLQIDVETGLGGVLDANGNPREPQLFLRWSDDGGHTWSNYHTLNCGLVGQTKRRAIQKRMGRSRDRVYEVTATDPVAWVFVDAYLRANPSFKKGQQAIRAVYRGLGI